MGLYNKGNLPKPLNDNICLICNTGGIHPIDKTPAQSCFEYICENCNKDVVIQVSDFVLTSEEERNKVSKNDILKQKIHDWKEATFLISTETIK